MISDDDRREVARRLRELADYCDENEMSLSDDDWPGILSDYIWPEDGGYHIYDDDCRRLADLIEPRCDREALLALADKVVADTEEDVRSEDLVSAWQAGEALRDVASKIREACGEAVA